MTGIAARARRYGWIRACGSWGWRWCVSSAGAGERQRTRPVSVQLGAVWVRWLQW